MIAKSRVWLVLAGLAAAAGPTMAQEVILEIPERRPPPPASLDRAPAETPPPARKPEPASAPRPEIVPPPIGPSGPTPSLERAVPKTEAATTEPTADLVAEDAAIEDSAPEDTAPEDTLAEDLATDNAGTESENAESESPQGEMPDSEATDSEIAVVPPPPVRKPRPGDRPTVAWKSLKVAAERERCDKVLDGLTIDYERLQPIKRGACGAPAPILVKSIGAGLPVAIEPAATMRCKLAAALDTWLNDQVQPAALEAFGSPVVKIRNISSYKCRNRYNAANTKISEHAFANALDISEFELASGRRITVLKGWPRIVEATAPPPPEPNPDRQTPELTPVKSDPDAAFTPPPEASPPIGPEPRDESEFLQLIHANACKTFNTVLGPKSNAAHKNHFHLDMKVRRYVTICE